MTAPTSPLPDMFCKRRSTVSLTEKFQSCEINRIHCVTGVGQERQLRRDKHPGSHSKTNSATAEEDGMRIEGAKDERDTRLIGAPAANKQRQGGLMFDPTQDGCLAVELLVRCCYGGLLPLDRLAALQTANVHLHSWAG